MGTGKQYDEEFKKQAIKLAKEIGTKAAADELCIPKKQSKYNKNKGVCHQWEQENNMMKSLKSRQ